MNFALASGNGVLLGNAYPNGSGSDIYVSDSMELWNSILLNAIPGVASVPFANGRFTAFNLELREGSVYGIIRLSSDGRNWLEEGSLSGLFVDGLPTSLLYTNGAYLAYGSTRYVFVSRDLISWSRHDSGIVSPGSNYFTDAHFWLGRFVLSPPGKDGQFQLLSEATPPAVQQVGLRSGLCRRLPDGAMLLTVEAPYGRSVTVEASSDLATWTTIATDSCDTGEFEVYDEGAKALGHRFYRAWQAGP
jgi:hypothetical protein